MSKKNNTFSTTKDQVTDFIKGLVVVALMGAAGLYCASLIDSLIGRFFLNMKSEGYMEACRLEFNDYHKRFRPHKTNDPIKYRACLDNNPYDGIVNKYRN